MVAILISAREVGGEAGGPLELPNRGALFCVRTAASTSVNRSQSSARSRSFELKAGGEGAGLWLCLRIRGFVNRFASGL